MSRKVEKLIRKGAIQEKKEKLEKLEIDIDGLIKEINYALFMDDGVRSINLELAKIRFDSLIAAVEEYQTVKKELEELE